MRRLYSLVTTILIGLIVVAIPISGTGQDQAPVYSTPLGIALDEYPYPYPVKFLTLDIEG
jgi:hypothetical protein